MKVILCVLILGVCGPTFGQGDGPCYDPFCLSVSDTGCDPAGCTQYPPDGSTTRTFTVPCNANYNFAAAVICEGTSTPCGNCNSCVWVYPTKDPTNVIGRIHTVDCPTGECSIQDPHGLSLVEGVNYTIAVCLTPCPNHACNECSTSCVAYGCLWHNNITGCCL